MLFFVTFSFTVSGDKIIKARKLDMPKKINFELWFEILVELNFFLVRLKPVLLIFTFCNFFDNISYLSQNTYF